MYSLIKCTAKWNIRYCESVFPFSVWLFFGTGWLSDYLMKFFFLLTSLTILIKNHVLDPLLATQTVLKLLKEQLQSWFCSMVKNSSFLVAEKAKYTHCVFSAGKIYKKCLCVMGIVWQIKDWRWDINGKYSGTLARETHNENILKITFRRKLIYYCHSMHYLLYFFSSWSLQEFKSTYF